MLNKLISNFSYNSLYTIIWYLLLFIVIVLYLWIYYHKFGRLHSHLSRFDGPKCQSIFLGNIPMITGNFFFKPIPKLFTEKIIEVFEGVIKVYHKLDCVLFWIGWQPVIVIYKPDMAEIILSSNRTIDKSENYDYFHPWLGTGLLTSTGKKWFTHRKLITPAFHFKILEDFIPIFNEQSQILVNKWAQKGFVNDIASNISLCTLDIICETAMGVTINAQSNEESEYVKSVVVLGESFMHRNLNMLGWYDSTFYMTSFGREYKRCLSIIHNFTRKVISDRKREIKNNSNKNISHENEDLVIGQKKRLAFLDLLLENHLSLESSLTEEDIREEVDTFMFEGHDTTSMGICWALYFLGLYDECQQNVHNEIDEIFGDDKQRPINSDDLKKMKYLECCIKEAQRLMPSVPMIARYLNEDFQMKNHTIPKGTTAIVLVYSLHRNPEYFPNPEQYIPERFLPQSTLQRHPFAYVPFSAGPRNCVGQKFALMEEKIVIGNVLRNFYIKSLDQRDKLRIGAELVTRPKCPLRMTFTKR